MLKKLKDYLKKKIYEKYAMRFRGPFTQGKYPNSWPQLQTYMKKHAKKMGIKGDIHESDFLFQFIMNQTMFASDSDFVESYYTNGKESAKKLSSLLNSLGIKFHSSKSLFEFASGYGMVTRHLVKELAPIRIVCCDIHEEAINFLKSVFHVEAILSNTVPENVKLNESYDVVFALSFFSHMPDKTFGRWLKKLYEVVKPQGYLIFTTHGQTSAKNIKIEIPESGIFFANSSEQKDLDTNDYGCSCVDLKYVEQQAKKYLNASITSMAKAEWWGHQDLYIIRKE